jgi:hypothetical protein
LFITFVHVRSPAIDIAKSGCLEGELHTFQGQALAASPVAVLQTDVVKSVVGKVPLGMALDAAGLAVEEIEAALGVLADGGFVARDPPIERGLAGDDGALEAGDGTGNGLLVDGFTGIGLSEEGWEAIGPRACISRLSARPSQKSRSDQAALRMVGDRRPSCFIPVPMPFGSPSPQENPGL